MHCQGQDLYDLDISKTKRQKRNVPVAGATGQLTTAAMTDIHIGKGVIPTIQITMNIGVMMDIIIVNLFNQSAYNPFAI